MTNTPQDDLLVRHRTNLKSLKLFFVENVGKSHPLNMKKKILP